MRYTLPKWQESLVWQAATKETHPKGIFHILLEEGDKTLDITKEL